MKNHVKIIGPNTSGIDVRALIADLQLVIDLSNTPGGSFILTLNGLVGAKTPSGFSGKIPVFSTVYLFRDKSELVHQLTPCLKSGLSNFLQAYVQIHAEIEKSVFYFID